MPRTSTSTKAFGSVLCGLFVFFATTALAADPAPQSNETIRTAARKLFARDNLTAWCIVPFDGKNRGPVERVEMLERLKFRHYAYDWRDQHLPTFETEVTELQKRGIELTAVWFYDLDERGQLLLDVLRKHGIKTQLWIMGQGNAVSTPEEQAAQVSAEAERLRPIVDAAAALGCTVGLYNHGGWFGEPENQIAIIKQLDRPNVGIVYNLHHGHGHVDRLPQLLKEMMPYLLSVNLNGMASEDTERRKILPLGAGELDLSILKTICESGYQGRIGIIGHTNDDVEERLRDNLDGLDWLAAQLEGNPPPPKPTYRTPMPAPPVKVNHRPTNREQTVAVLDHSAADGYLAVKSDPEGRLFVGGRESLFVFDPDPNGGYKPRQELFHFPQDSMLIGVEWRGNDLFVLTATALYVLPNGRIEREGLKPQRLLWGVPFDLHVSFHCLAWGPEGDLYVNHGDPLLNHGDWTRPDHWGYWTLHLEPGDRKVPYVGAGSVLRVRLSRPDVSAAKSEKVEQHIGVDSVEVVATGLRGPVGLAFDKDWNLYTNDNDHESMADRYAPARLLFVTHGIDFGWPRGWMASMSPERWDLVEPMSADLGRGVPCDMVYCDEPTRSDDLRNRLLMARWDRHAVTAYPLAARGASMNSSETTFLEGDNDARPVGVAVGNDGQVYVTSLYMTGNAPSPHCESDVIVVSEPPREADQSKSGGSADAYDPTAANARRLWSELSHPSWQRRLWAHQEILRRGPPLLDKAVDRLAALPQGSGKTTAAQARLWNHLIWLAAASHDDRAANLLQRLAQSDNADVRWQSLRALLEMSAGHVNSRVDAESSPSELARAVTPLFVGALSDSAPRIQMVGLQFFQRVGGDVPWELVEQVGSTPDSYLRQTAARLLASRADVRDLIALLRSDRADSRLLAVLAIGTRLTVPPTHEAPSESIPLVLREVSPWFQTTIHFADASEPIDLSEAGRAGSYTIAEAWKSVRHSREQEALFGVLLAALDSSDRRVQLQVAYYLGLLNDPRSDPVVTRSRLNILVNDLIESPHTPVEQMWFVGPFSAGHTDSTARPDPEQGAVDLTTRYGELAWSAVQAQSGVFVLPGETSPASTSYGYFSLHSASRCRALLQSRMPHAMAGVWHNGRPIEPVDSAIVAGQSAWLLDLQPGSNDVMLQFHNQPIETRVSLSARAQDRIEASLPERLGSAVLLERLRAASQSEGSTIAPEFSNADWNTLAGTGSIEQGRQLFGTLGCGKCHAVRADQEGRGAPSLADARRRFTVMQAVESILMPSTQVAGTFRASTIALTNGQVLNGLVISEDAEKLVLLQVDATRKTIPKDDIDERVLTILSPMPPGLVKTPEELKNLLTYLLSENPAPP